MNRWIVLGLIVALPLTAAAQTYKWKDKNGQVHFTQMPPKSGVAYEVIGPAPPPQTAPNQDALNESLQKSNAEAPKREEAAAQAAAQQAKKQEACRKALDRIAYLESRSPNRLATKDDQGTPSRMTTEEHARLIQFEQEQVAKNCQ